MARKKRSEKQQARLFGLILPVILIGLAGLAYWRGHANVALALALAAPAVILCAVALPRLWLRVFLLWMKLAEALGWVMTRVLLSVFFFLVLTPIGLLMRLLGKTPLDLAWKDGKPTYWLDKDPDEFTLERYEKRF